MMLLENPIRTEKAITRIEKLNALTFRVALSADKKSLREEIEKRFNYKVLSVKTYLSKGKKYAVIRFQKDFKAEDLAAKLKIVA